MPSPTYEILWSRTVAGAGYVMWVRYPTIQIFTSWRIEPDGTGWVPICGSDTGCPPFATIEEAQQFAEASYALTEES